MTHTRHVALALAAVALAAGPALAQTGATTPRPPLGVPSTIDPRTGLSSGQAPADPRTGSLSTPPPSTDPGSTLTTPAPPQAPPPIPRTGPPMPSTGQPITPSTVDPRTGLPR
jgi:hypothetical protein